MAFCSRVSSGVPVKPPSKLPSFASGKPSGRSPTIGPAHAEGSPEGGHWACSVGGKKHAMARKNNEQYNPGKQYLLTRLIIYPPAEMKKNMANLTKIPVKGVIQNKQLVYQAENAWPHSQYRMRSGLCCKPRLALEVKKSALEGQRSADNRSKDATACAVASQAGSIKKNCRDPQQWPVGCLRPHGGGFALTGAVSAGSPPPNGPVILPSPGQPRPVFSRIQRKASY